MSLFKEYGFTRKQKRETQARAIAFIEGLKKAMQEKSTKNPQWRAKTKPNGMISVYAAKPEKHANQVTSR